MNKLNTFLAEHGIKIIIALLILSYFKSCSIDSETEKVKKELKAVRAEMDTLDASITTRVITSEEMKELIKTTPAWNTLRIEEMSDKEKISINAVKSREEGYDK